MIAFPINILGSGHQQAVRATTIRPRFRMGRLLLALIMLPTALLTISSRAAEIRMIQPSRIDGMHNGSIDLDTALSSNMKDDAEVVCNLRLEGAIEAGDEQRLLLTLRNVGHQQIDGLRLCLNSPGGSYDEGLKLAEILMREGVGTAVEPGARCASACALIFMAGSSAWKGQINRFMHVNGRLLFHAPSIETRAVGDQSFKADDLATSYQAAVRSINRLIRIAGKSVPNRFPNELLQEMLDRGPSIGNSPADELFAVDTVGKAIRYRIGLYGAMAPTTLSPMVICNACVNFHYGARDDVGEGQANSLCGTRDVASARQISLGSGERVTLDVAPRGGECVIDIKGSSSRATAWFMHSLGSSSSGFADEPTANTVSLSYWYLYSPNTPISSLSNGSVRRQTVSNGPLSVPNLSDLPSTRVEQRVADFIEHEYLQDREHFADQVDFYDKGIVSRDFIVKDQRKYAQRWPIRKYQLTPGTLSIGRRASGEFIASFRYSYFVANGPKSKSGQGSSEVILRDAGTDFLVVGVKEIVHR